MTPLPIIFAGTFSRLDVREVKTESVRALRRYFGIKFFIVRNTVKKENLDVWLLSIENEALFTCHFTSLWFQSF